MVTTNANDVWYYRNQPYGLWKAGNPLIKFICITIILWGAFFNDPLVMIQGTLLCIILLYMPSRPNSKIFNIAVNFGIGSSLIYFVSRYFPLLETLPHHSEIPQVATINWIVIFSYTLIIFAFIKIRVAITSRDLAWFIDITPRICRDSLGGQIYSYIYGIFRFPEILSNLSERILSRGGCRPFGKKTCKKFNVLVEIIGLWCLNLLRHIDDMTLTVEYVLQSRIKIMDRSHPSKESWSSVDFSIAGIILFSIILPRIINI